MAGWDDIPDAKKDKTGWDDIPDVSPKSKPFFGGTVPDIPGDIANIAGSTFQAITSPMQTGKAFVDMLNAIAQRAFTDKPDIDVEGSQVIADTQVSLVIQAIQAYQGIAEFLVTQDTQESQVIADTQVSLVIADTQVSLDTQGIAEFLVTQDTQEYQVIADTQGFLVIQVSGHQVIADRLTVLLEL